MEDKIRVLISGGQVEERIKEMAEQMKIPWEQFRWYAAFHDEGEHPHVVRP